MISDAAGISDQTLVTQPDFIYAEDDPFERIRARLDGIKAIGVIAATATRCDSPPTEMVWEDLWCSITLMTEDVTRDMYQLLQDNNQLVRDSLKKGPRDAQP